MSGTVEERQSKNKELLLEQLVKIPIVQIACEKVGVSRATYYRWRDEDVEFMKQSNKAIISGNLLINDIAESQLISAMKDKNMTAIIFWLKHHHSSYTTSIQITSGNRNECLSDDEISELSKLLFNKDTFKRGQELLTAYVFKGVISEKYAQLVLKLFLSQLKVEDTLTRKAEVDILSEVFFRKKIK